MTDWISAWGQVGGAIATTVAVVVALWLAQRDRRWRRADLSAAAAEHERRATAQARLVVSAVDAPEMWSGDEADKTTFRARRAGNTFIAVQAHQLVRVTITNGSAGPIFSPRVEKLHSPVFGAAPVVGIYDTAAESMAAAYPDVLVAGASVEVPAVCEDVEANLIDTWMAAQAEISYIDADGQRWHRKGVAVPARVGVDPDWVPL